jgi:hypothetical protein
MTKADYDSSMAWIEEKKFYNLLSLREELVAYERVQARYEEGSEERKKTEREIFALKKSIQDYENDSWSKDIDEQNEKRKKEAEYWSTWVNESNEKQQKLEKDTFDKAMDYIDEKKFYGQIALNEELALTEDLAKNTNVSGENRKKLERDIFTLKKNIANENKQYVKDVLAVEKDANDKRKKLEDDYYDKVTKTNEKLKQDIQSVTDAYTNAINSRESTLYSSYSLFDKIEKKESISGDSLVTNLRDQVSEFNTWRNQITSLSGKGVDNALIKELEAMGPKSLEEIKALNTLSSYELDNYVSLWKTKHKDARSQAISELETLRIESEAKIKEMTLGAEKELLLYKEAFDSNMLELQTDTLAALKVLETEWLGKIRVLREGTEKEFEKMSENIQKTIKDPDWVGLGGSIIDGISGGVNAKASELAFAAAKAASEALAAAKAVLGVNSPSKEFAKLGVFSIEGFIIGLQSLSGKITTTGTNIGSSAMDALRGAISNISDVINGEVNPELTIRPVLDLSNVEAGSQRIGQLINQNKGLNIASINGKIPVIDQSSKTDEINQNGSISPTSPITFTQINNSPKALSRLEIYRQTKNQISTMKGLVSTT